MSLKAAKAAELMFLARGLWLSTTPVWSSVFHAAPVILQYRELNLINGIQSFSNYRAFLR
jgi:hypothetical protein